MKTPPMALLSVLMLACFAPATWAQSNPRATSSITLKGKTVSVEYGRPSLKRPQHGSVTRRME